MEQDQEDVKCLLEQYDIIKKHHKGELRLFVSEREGGYLSIQIFAGRRFDFLIKIVKNTDF